MVTKKQGMKTSRSSQNAEERRDGFNPHLSRYQASATNEVPLDRQKPALWGCSSQILALLLLWYHDFTAGNGIWATPLPAS